MKVPFFEGELIRRGTLVFLATLSASIIVLFANIILSNILGTEYFGVFRTVFYLFAFLPMLIDLGINASLTKHISEFGKKRNKEIKYLISWFLKIKVISYILLIVIIFLLKDYIAIYFLKDISLSYLVYVGIFSAALTFFSVFSFIVLGFQDFKLFSFSQFLVSASSAFLAILFSPLGIFYIILGWGLGYFIGNIPNILFVLKKDIFSNYEKIDMKKIFFKFNLPIYPIELSAMLFNVVVPFLSLFFSQKLISYYSFAFIFYIAALLIPNSLSTVLFPKVSELNGLKRHADARDILKKSFMYYSIIVIIGLIFVILFSEWLISLIASSYLPSLLIFKIIVSLGFIFGYNVIYSNYLKGLGKLRRYAFFVLAQNILLIIVSFTLINTMV